MTTNWIAAALAACATLFSTAYGEEPSPAERTIRLATLEAPRIRLTDKRFLLTPPAEASRPLVAISEPFWSAGNDLTAMTTHSLMLADRSTGLIDELLQADPIAWMPLMSPSAGWSGYAAASTVEE